MTRDLEADLAICEAATPGPWIFNGNEIVASNDKRKGIAGALADEDCQFIAKPAKVGHMRSVGRWQRRPKWIVFAMNSTFCRSNWSSDAAGRNPV